MITQSIEFNLLKLCSAAILTLFPFILPAQHEEDKVETDELSLNLGVYLDLFYGYDFNRPTDETRLPYLYHHNRHNEVNLNHGIISIGLSHERFRTNFGLHTGTYVVDNYSSEPEVLKHIYDANVGVMLDNKNRWWIDIGIFGSSWIGMESTLSYENLNLGHNLISENVPYYYSGIKTTFQPNDSWAFSAIMTNGWQRIKRLEGNSLPSFGTQVMYQSAGGNSYHWNTFIGTDDPDSLRRIRVFNDLNTYIQVGEKLIFGAGVDVGFQQRNKNASEWDSWYGLAFILKGELNEKTSMAVRYEYYHDPKEVVVTSLNSQPGYTTSGISSNIDWHLFKILLLRLEARYFISPDPIYPERDQPLTRNNFFILGSIAVNWNKMLGL